VKVGFIGLGNIGRGIARDLIVPENEVFVYDVMAEGPAALKELGARVASSSAEVAQRADVVGVCVRNDADLHNVFEGADGILSTSRAGLLVAIHSTVRIETVRELATVAAKRGVHVVDAPVTKGYNSPPRKSVVVMVGGSPEDVERVRPYLELCALKIVPTGLLGSGMAMKICNNVLSYLLFISASEAVQMAEAVGLDLNDLATVTSNNGVAGPNLTHMFLARAGANPTNNTISPPLDAMSALGEKDLDCALDVGREFTLALPAVSMARNSIRSALHRLLR
jgi:3-hydroxyisobutyrate dehydrogenase